VAPQPLCKKINLILSLVAIVMFVVVFLLTGASEYKETLSQFSTVMRARINVARTLTRNALFETDIMVQTLLRSHPGDLKKLMTQLATSSYFEFHGDNFYVLDSQGKVILISEPYREYIGLDFRVMIPSESSPDRQVQHHFQSLLTNRSVVTIQYPLYNGYVLVVERDLENITPVIASFEEGKLYSGELFFVLSTDGRTIYHPNHVLMETRYNLGFDLKNITEANDAGLFSFAYQGEKFIAFRERFTEPGDWVMYYCIPSTVLNEVIKGILVSQLLFLFFVFFVLFFVFRIVFNRFFSHPVNSIVEALADSKQGNMLALSSDMSGGIVEFNTIIEAINSRDKEISGTSERFQTVLDSLDALVYVADMETHELLFINSYGRKIWGANSIGQKCYQVLQQDQDTPCDFCTNHLLLNAEGLPKDVHVWEFQNTITQQWFQCRDQAIRWTDGRLVRMEIAIDISGMKDSENALQAEKERLSVTLRSIGDGVITTDIEGRVVFLNKVAEELSGWTYEEAQGQPSTKVFNIVNEKNGQKCVSPVQRVVELGRIIGLANHTALIAKDGTIRSIADSGAPIRDRESNIVGVVLVFRDVTHEKKIEEELLKTRKLESIGVLAGGIAHDFNNILSAILGNLELVRHRIATKDSKAASLLSDAEKATKRAAKLTDQLLTFSKGGEPVREVTSLPKFISESADFVLHGSRIVCNYSLPEDLWLVDVDSGQIAQVIQNIIINAKHAMPEGGIITIECGNVEDAAAEALLSVDKGDYVRITIRDTGVGIPHEIITKIFDPYFTTKQEGSGLGLAICHSIVNKHDGYLTVHSIIGKGTTFTMYLPAVSAEADDGSIKEQTKSASAIKAARIMVMDDEEMLRNVATSQLAVLGHEAIPVIDGTQAINKYQELQDDDTPVDLVIMDLTIPGGMGGEEAAAKLLQIDPAAKIIVSSGYSNDPVMANYRKYGFVAAIAKPFDLKQLSNVISSILR
jgi:PAS domain S-box-containing protein